jgi:two-component system OmpR family sensor kinase
MGLRRRVLLGCLVVAAVLLVADMVLAGTFRGYLVRQVDERLVEATGRFADFATAPDRPAPRPGPRGGGPGRQGNGLQGLLSEFFVGVATNDGRLLGHLGTPLRSGQALPEPAAAQVRTAVTVPGQPLRPFTVSGAAGRGWRLVALRPAGSHEIVLVGSSLADIGPTYRRMLGVLAVATVAVLATLAVVASWVLRQGVAPLRDMTVTAEAIAGGALHERVSETDERTEAGRLGAALNAMLVRIERAFAERTAAGERLRRFVADASHELRTPLTSIRGYAELYRRGGLAERGGLDGAMRRIEQEAVRMGALVEDLLLLAKLDERRPLSRRPVDLAVVARDAVADLQALEPGRLVTFDGEPLELAGDEARLRQAVANLLGNARIHTPAGAPVHVRVSASGGWATVEVRDEGPGMAPEVAARAFERFYRADPARVRARGGSPEGAGLGLSIVGGIAEAHGGSVEVDTAPGQGARFRLLLPVGPTGEGS